MGKSRVRWFCFLFLKLSNNFRRCSPLKRSLIITVACVVYLFFVFSQVGLSQRHPRSRADEDEQQRHTRGSSKLGTMNRGAPDAAADSRNRASSVGPTRSNVVYITLKSKRLKPAHIRGTIRPKLRKKVRRRKTKPPVTQNKLGTAEHYAGQNHFGFETSWKQTPHEDHESLNIIPNDGADSQISSIRIYSQTAPPWFSGQDLKTMRFLADAKVLRVRKITLGDSPSLLIFEGKATVPLTNQSHSNKSSVCGGQCGVIHSSVDNSEVFAFHLDRVLGLNRTLPAVSRKFSFLQGPSCPVVSWDASLYPEVLAAGPFAVRLTWRQYQNSLTQRCWHKNIKPKPDSGCSTIHHYEWSKVALFDFLLQIHSRLDQSCCGFRPRREDVCDEVGPRASCKNLDNIKLANIIHRSHDLRHLVFTNNKGFFDRNEDNLDFRLLEGIKELPEEAVSVLRSRKLREKLLQSLFLDRFYWETQGGRAGIDKLIDVVERRAEVLLTYINAHGVRVVPMND